MDVVRVRRLYVPFLSIARRRVLYSHLNLVTSRPLVAEFAFLSPVIAPETTMNVPEMKRANREGFRMRRRCQISEARIRAGIRERVPVTF